MVTKYNEITFEMLQEAQDLALKVADAIPTSEPTDQACRDAWALVHKLRCLESRLLATPTD